MPIAFVTDDFISLPDLSVGETGNNLYYSAGIRPDGLSGNVDIISQQGTDQEPNTYIRLQTRGTELGAFIRNNANSSITLTGTTLSTGVLYIVGLEKNGTTWNLYLNGNIDDTGVLADDFTLEAAAIGSFPDGASNFFNGSIEEVLAWNNNLTAKERGQTSDAKLRGHASQIQKSNLTLYCPMDDGSNGTSANGDTIRDLSGNGNDGTGDNGPNNTGLTYEGSKILSPQSDVMPVIFTPVTGSPWYYYAQQNRNYSLCG